MYELIRLKQRLPRQVLTLILDRSSGGLRGSRPVYPAGGRDQAKQTSQSAYRTCRAALLHWLTQSRE